MTKDRWIRCITRLQNLVGYVVPAERAALMASALAGQRWTRQEAANAYYLIPEDPRLMKEIYMEKTIGPSVFALARRRFAVQRGRLFYYDRARHLAQRHGQPLEKIFDVVRVEGREGPDGLDQPFWRVKDTYSPPPETD